MTCDIFESPCLPCKIFINESRNETGTFIATVTEILNDILATQTRVGCYDTALHRGDQLWCRYYQSRLVPSPL